MKKLFVLCLVLMGCADSRVKMHMVTCRFPQDTFTDTIITTDVVWPTRTVYRIADAYYPIAFCTVRTQIKS
jgi:hypothetical protein